MTRQDVLKLPHWEFYLYATSLGRQDARDTLNTSQAIGLALGGGKSSKRIFRQLEEAAGYRQPEKKKATKKPGLSWTRQLFVGAFN